MKTIKTIDIIRYNRSRGLLYKLFGVDKAIQLMNIIRKDGPSSRRLVSNRVRSITYNYISDKYLNENH